MLVLVSKAIMVFQYILAMWGKISDLLKNNQFYLN